MVKWHVGDVTQYNFGTKQFDVWHDRAVFHFLTQERDRRAYVELVQRSVKTGGYVLMATFGPQGPVKCSGLDVVRYDDKKLHESNMLGFSYQFSRRVRANQNMRSDSRTNRQSVEPLK